MKVLLIDIDSKIPNLALATIQKYHLDRGDKVIWNNELFINSVDKTYVSCIFTKNKYKCKDFEGRAEIGGSGYDIYKKLPEEIAKINPHINLGFTCYDDKTEVLTQQGWKSFVNLTKKDNIATFNQYENLLEYQHPTEIVTQKYSGQMIFFKNKYVDLAVTPNHRMYVNIKQTKEKYQILSADKVSGFYNIEFKKNAVWTGQEKQFFFFSEGSCSSRENIIKKHSMDSWLEFMGYYLSEGNIQYKPKIHSYITKISQKIGTEKYNKMKSCIEK